MVNGRLATRTAAKQPGLNQTQLSLAPRLQHFEEATALHPVGLGADSQLVVPARLPASAANITVYVARVKPTGSQEKLQFLTFLQRQRRLVLGPCRLERTETAQPVGEMADRERVGIGIVVTFDHFEVGENEEHGSAVAGGKEQARLVARPGKGLAADALDAELVPLAERARAACLLRAEAGG